MESNSKSSLPRTGVVSVDGIGDKVLVVVGGSVITCGLVVTCGSLVTGGVGAVE